MNLSGRVFYPFLAILHNLDVGVSIGWSMPAGVYLSNEHPRRVVGGNPSDLVPGFSSSSLSWIFSIQVLVLCLTTLIYGLSEKKFSPKNTLFFCGFFKLLFWCLLFLANTTVFWVILARLALGLGHMLFASLPLYIEEITEATNRGLYVSFCDWSLNLGILIGFILGIKFSFQMNLWILFFFSLTIWIGTIILPESPIWLKENKQKDKALKSLKRIRPSTHDFDSELNNIDKYLKTKLEEKLHFLQFLKFLKSKSHYCKSLFLVMLLFIFQQLSGITIIVFYALTILKGNNLLDEHFIIIISGTSTILGSIISSFVTDRWGRRPLLLTSEGLVAVCLAIFSIYTSIRNNIDSLIWDWIPIIAISVHGFMMNLGLGPLPFVIMTEILPCQIRYWGSYLGIFFFAITSFIVIKTFDPLQHILGAHYIFALYSFFSIIGFLYIFNFLPETKNIPRHLMEETLYLKTSPENIEDESLKP